LDNYAYVAYGNSGLRIIDVSTPTAPVEVGFLNFGGHARGVYVSGRYAYVASGGSGLRIIDVSNPTNPVEVGFFDKGGVGVYVSDSYAYVASGVSDLYIIRNDLITNINSKVGEQAPETFVLNQNYPNPFNPSTIIEFNLPKSIEVTLKIFNILGQEVETLVSDRLSSGSYKYIWDASNYASGVYLYRLQAGDYVKTLKMVLMK
jgi:hypothetical protein